ncbi:SH3 and cysteine-rich domain-containing protein [Pseudonaja textilis]|uniref:SH3 and cysteine-rich domain-containing protein n=1 Tax=Pseudonaja textilis TaxID=8673 RepID=UPI000EA8CDE4|nr:SH3 and cysteine-rich domain-containing protein [Pseudonaja textilis]
MIPPGNATEVSLERVENENDIQPPSPASTTSQESKLQKLKQSLSFKTNSLRSKSADNFFQQTNCGTKLQVDLLSEITSKMGQLPNLENQNSTPTKTHLQPEDKTHIFEEHIFKKPTFCDVCNHMIVGTNAKHGLRCKACKLSIHHKCAESTGQQRCMGKLPKGFHRYYSSPLLIQEQFGCIKEVMPIAQAAKISDKPATKTEKSECIHSAWGTTSKYQGEGELSKLSEDKEEIHREKGNIFAKLDLAQAYQQLPVDEETAEAQTIGSLNKDSIQMNIYVALYKFLPQEHEDLEMRPGDRIILLEDSNEDWWKGKIEDRIGFFPANFVQRLQDEKVFKCIRTFIGCKEQGQITLKENQICITSEKEQDGFIKVCSGKKKGFVPIDVLEDI